MFSQERIKTCKVYWARAEKSWWGFALAGMFGALSLPPWYCLFFLPFSLFFLFHGALYAPSWKKTAWWGFLYGMGWHVTDLYWLTDAILTRIEDFWWAIPIAAPGVSLLIAPLMALPPLAARLAFVQKGKVTATLFKNSKKRTIASLLLFAGMWPLSDLARTYIFTGFPWNPPGSALAFPGIAGNICLQTASWVGVDGLTFFLILGCMAPFFGRKALMGTFGGVFLFLLISVGRYYFPPQPVHAIKNPNVLIVQGSVSETEIFTRRSGAERFHHYLSLTRSGVDEVLKKETARDKSLVVVWPESAFPFLLDESDGAQEMMAEASRGHWVISGSLRRDRHGIYNTAQAISPEGEDRFIYAKSRLVPFGEYQPGIIPFNILPDQLTPGEGLTTWEAPELGAVSPLVCYEMIFPGHVADVKKRPGWILTISNDAWYGHSAGPWQHMMAGRLRSVEEGLPLVFVNNFGPSAAYSPLGTEIASIGWGKFAAQLAELPSPFPPTFFAKFGRLTAVLISVFSCFAGLALLLLAFREDEKARKKEEVFLFF